MRELITFPSFGFCSAWPLLSTADYLLFFLPRPLLYTADKPLWQPIMLRRLLQCLAMNPDFPDGL
jgi:hypothetical protein